MSDNLERVHAGKDANLFSYRGGTDKYFEKKTNYATLIEYITIQIDIKVSEQLNLPKPVCERSNNGERQSLEDH